MVPEHVKTIAGWFRVPVQLLGYLGDDRRMDAEIFGALLCASERRAAERGEPLVRY